MSKLVHDYDFRVVTDTEYECVLKVPLRGRALERVVLLSRERAFKKANVPGSALGAGFTVIPPSLFGLVNSGVTPVVSEVRKGVADAVKVINWRVVSGSYSHSDKILSVVIRGDYVDV